MGNKHGWRFGRPLTNGLIAALAVTPYTLYKMATDQDMDLLSPELYLPPLALATTSFGTMLLTLLTGKNRVRLADYATIQSIEEQLKEEDTPTIAAKETQPINCSFPDLLRFFHWNSDADKWEQKAKETQNPAHWYFAYLWHADKGKPLAAFNALRELTDTLGKQPKAIGWLGLITNYFYQFEKITAPLSIRSIHTYIDKSVRALFRKPEQAWYQTELGKRVAHDLDIPFKTELYLAHALLANSQQRSDEQQAWNDFFSMLNDQEEWEWIGETRNKLWKLDGFSAETVFVKGNINRDALLAERQATETLEGILEQDAVVPSSLYVSEEPYQGYYAYAMRHLSGETLYEQLERNEKGALTDVVEVLAKIHARYPTAELTRVNIDEKTKSKLYAPELNIPQDLAQTILSHYMPVKRAVTENAIWAAVKDAHPENWIIGDQIGVIDAEISHTAPVTFDLANLLEYQDVFTRQEKRSYVLHYARHLRQEGEDPVKEDFARAYEDDKLLMRAYSNSVIHRVICLVSAWSSPERTRMQTQRRAAVNRAVQAIDDLKQEDKEYYAQYEHDYVELKKSFMHLKTLF